ncbi:MAG: hypothetical protein WCQ96_00225 [Patescibacteria group bacterium]
MLEEGIPHSESIPWMMRNLPDLGWYNGVVAIDGIRHPAADESMEELFPSSILVFCDCPEKEIIRRVCKRDGVTEKEAKKFLGNQAEEDHREYFLRKADFIITPATDLKEVVKQIGLLLKSNGNSLVIGIAGRMGAGKSTFANTLVEYLS